MPPKVVLGVVLYGSRYLRESLPSLLAQDYEQLEIILLDQEAELWSASEHIQKELPEITKDPRVKLTQGTNKMHSGGHNTIIQRALQSQAQYYICASNDMLYAPDCITQLVRELEQPESSQVGSVAAKLLVWDFANSKKLNQLDSTGITITATGRFADRGQGQADTGQYDPATPVWGASGALAGYRVSALAEVALGTGQYFDPTLHYKDDVELAARLRAAGLKCRYVPLARAWHARGLSTATRAASSEQTKADSLTGQLALTQRHWTSLPITVRLRHYALLSWSILKK